MKLLLVTSYLDDGGAEKWMLDTIKNMDKTGVSIDYYFWGDIKNDNFLKTYEEMGVKLYFRKLESKKNRLPFCLGHDFRMFIKEHGPYDAVHVNGTKLIYQMIIMKVSKKTRIPVRMVHSHSSNMKDLSGIKNTIRNYFRKSIINNATIVGGCSQLATQTKYGGNIINNNKYFIFKNGIDYKKYLQCSKNRIQNRKDLCLKDELILLHIGRFNREKNQSFLINIFFEILKTEKDAKLILIGHGEDEKKVFDQIKELGIKNNIIHIPYTTETEKYYSVADCFLFPSLYEGLGLVLIESQAAGIPCIVSEEIPREALINKNIRVLSLKDSAKIWAKETLKLAGNFCDNAQKNIYNAGYDVIETSDAFLRCCKERK